MRASRGPERALRDSIRAPRVPKRVLGDSMRVPRGPERILRDSMRAPGRAGEYSLEGICLKHFHIKAFT